MEARRELDALIAQTVMGWAICGYAAYDDWLARSNRGDVDIVFIDRDGVVWRAVGDLCNVWSPSTDIAAAWQVVERLAIDHHWAVISRSGPQSDHWQVQAEFSPFGSMTLFREIADTAPLAICLAGLRAVGVEVS